MSSFLQSHKAWCVDEFISRKYQDIKLLNVLYEELHNKYDITPEDVDTAWIIQEIDNRLLEEYKARRSDDIIYKKAKVKDLIEEPGNMKKTELLINQLNMQEGVYTENTKGSVDTLCPIIFGGKVENNYESLLAYTKMLATLMYRLEEKHNRTKDETVMLAIKHVQEDFDFIKKRINVVVANMSEYVQTDDGLV